MVSAASMLTDRKTTIAANSSFVRMKILPIDFYGEIILKIFITGTTGKGINKKMSVPNVAIHIYVYGFNII